MSRRVLSFLAILVLGLALAWLSQDTPVDPTPSAGQVQTTPRRVAPVPATARAAPPARTDPKKPDATPKAGLRTTVQSEVKSYGKVVYRGPVDLAPTIARIEAGERHPHRNDGAVFKNRERRLPKKPRGYYREYVHPTRGRSGPGPQRIVVGRGGEWYYTPDHYETFVPLHE